MKLKFLKGTKLYSTVMVGYDTDDMLVPSGKVLEENYECDKPENDYHITIAGPIKSQVTAETRIHYKDGLYLKVGDASNYSIISSAKAIYNHPHFIYIILGIIASGIIGFIWYKRKH